MTKEDMARVIQASANFAGTSSMTVRIGDVVVKTNYRSLVANIDNFVEGKRRDVEPEVPKGAERLLNWITHPDRVEAVLGDIERRFRMKVKANGEFKARRWYWEQIAHSAVYFLVQTILRGVGVVYLLRKLGLL
jgi:hypothetical protein